MHIKLTLMQCISATVFSMPINTIMVRIYELDKTKSFTNVSRDTEATGQQLSYRKKKRFETNKWITRLGTLRITTRGRFDKGTLVQPRVLISAGISGCSQYTLYSRRTSMKTYRQVLQIESWVEHWNSSALQTDADSHLWQREDKNTMSVPCLYHHRRALGLP